MKLVKHILRDLTKDKHRALLSMLAMILGMSAFGITLFCYNVIIREIPNVFSESNPSSAAILIDRVDEKLYDIIDQFEGIITYEASGYYNYRIKVQEEWKTLELFASDSYNEKIYNKPTLLDGILTLEIGDALIEGDAKSVAKADIGDAVSIMLNHTTEKEVRLVGVVNDLGNHPASMHNVVYLYINFTTLKEWGLAPNKIEYVVSGDEYDRNNILQISDEFISLLQSHGYTVTNLQVEETPGESMHMKEYEGALLLLQMFSIISLLFGCMIMSNLISSILSKQVRQIGVIKAIGGTYKSIVLAYLLAILLVIVIALGVSTTAVLLISGKLSDFLLSIGNMIPETTVIPRNIVAIYFTCTLFAPIIISAFPIFKALRVTVREAFQDYGISNSDGNKASIKQGFLSRPVMVSIRNALRRKGRFILNVTILVLTGTIFILVLSNMVSVQSAINKSIGMLNYDYEMTVSGLIEEEQIANVVEELDQIESCEIWSSVTGQHLYTDGQIGNSYSIISPANQSEMIDPIMTKGRWIDVKDGYQVAVTEKFLENESQYSLGDSVEFQIGGKSYQFEIVGVIHDFNMAKIYISRSIFDEIVNRELTSQSIKLITTEGKGRRSYYTEIDTVFEEKEIYLYTSESIKELKSTLEGHYSVTLQTFLIIIILIVAIAGFGLSATMNAQTSERKKEIGVMKAIGASRKQIILVITIESIFISLTSCIGAVILGSISSMVSIPLFGEIINVPLTAASEPILLSSGAWIILSFTVGYMASRKVAKRTAAERTKEIFSME